MGVILQVALPSRVLAAARLQCGAAGAGASRGLGVCAEHARLAARGESARAMEIGDFLVGLVRRASPYLRIWPERKIEIYENTKTPKTRLKDRCGRSWDDVRPWHARE